MKMQKGYQIIEPTSLGTLLANPSQAAVAVAVLAWTIDRIKTQFPQLFDEVEVEVIPVTYQGTYPAIGIHYKNEGTNDVGPMLSNAIDAFVSHISFSDFMSFVNKTDLYWCDIWQELKGKL